MKINQGRHKPNRFASYVEIHETVVEQYTCKSFINKNNLMFNWYPNGCLISGEISCRGNIILAVDKFLQILGGFGKDAIVQTAWYSYNASVRGFGNIFRYDNQDNEFLRVGHKDEHHKHLFNWSTGAELPESPIWVGYDNWLTLGEVIEELHDWYWEWREALPCPDCYPSIGGWGNPSLEL